MHHLLVVLFRADQTDANRKPAVRWSLERRHKTKLAWFCVEHLSEGGVSHHPVGPAEALTLKETLCRGFFCYFYSGNY